MGEYKNKAFTLRIDNELMEKMRNISEKESRTLTKQIEIAIKQHINEYERTHNITIQIGRDNNGNINL